MNVAVLETLEYHKVREMLADLTGSVVGKELALELLPTSEVSEVRTRLEETSEAKRILSTALQVPLGGIREVRSVIKRAELGAVLDPTDFLAIAGTLYAARRMKTFFSNLAESAPLLFQEAALIQVLTTIETAIAQTISEQGTVRDEASVELSRLRKETRLTQHRLKEKIDHILHSAEYQKYFQETLVTIRNDRYVIPVKQEYRQHFPGIVHDQSASGATVFIEPMAVVTLNNDIKQLMAAERNEILRVLTVLSSQIARVAPVIYENVCQLAYLDFSFAKASLSIKMQAEMPTINQSGQVKLFQARHPLIPSVEVVPIDVELGKDFTTLLITGPNTGGKTVSLKTVGLFSLMTQAGLFIPAASGSTMPIFRNIFADIGDEQSIEQSLSTFSGHMKNLVHILEDVSGQDLVLIDEIGAGTDPQEGAALAMAILDYLYEKGARTIATTHYSELKTFAYTRPGVENGSVEFNVETLRPTYRLLIGIPGSSNAFAISHRLGLPTTIIDKARQMTKSEHKEFETVLSELEEQRRLYLDRMSHMQAEEQELSVMRRRLTQEQETWREKKQYALDKAHNDATALLRQTRREAEMLIRDLKAQFSVTEEKQRQDTVNNVRQRLRHSMQELTVLEPVKPDMVPLNITLLKPNDEVYVATLGQYGTVLSIGKDDLTVQLGSLKVSVSAVDCRASDRKVMTERKKNTGKANLAKVQDASRQIDIRGTTVEEGTSILDKFLDEAVMAGLHEVLVIHGKGTGALRKGIRNYLQNHPNIREMKIGEYNEGGDGVTVATLC